MEGHAGIRPPHMPTQSGVAGGLDGVPGTYQGKMLWILKTYHIGIQMSQRE